VLPAEKSDYGEEVATMIKKTTKKYSTASAGIWKA